MHAPATPIAIALAIALAACNQAPVDQAAPGGTAAANAASAAPAAPATAAGPDATAEDADVAAPQLQAAMRELWHGHIVHARDYALAVHAGDGTGAAASAEAVVENAKQISSAVAGFYGDAAGDRMLALLGGHWGAVKDMTDARAAGNADASARAMDDLTANAGEIAGFLAGANPNWPEDTLKGMLLAHGAHHSQQVDLILAGDTAGEAAEWTAMQSHMDMIADALAAGIAAQFPDKAA